MTTYILLTGAGFSRNWGGWLASEVFEYLLGSTELDEKTRQVLWYCRSTGFEDALTALARPDLSEFIYDRDTDETKERRLNNFQNALVSMFEDMTEGFMQRQFEFQNEIPYMVKTFLSKFDAIFTLNQDSLLEKYYLDAGIVGGKYALTGIPGIKPLDVGLLQEKMQQPDPDNFKLHPNIQPYIKLHGSYDWWTTGTPDRHIMIIGGDKAIEIKQFSILIWYDSLFKEFLSRHDARLMVIGYSFSDAHINSTIGHGVEHGLKVFIIDRCGVDVLEQANKRNPSSVMSYMQKLAPHIIGASRRPLTSTFGGDKVEHARIMKFFSTQGS